MDWILALFAGLGLGSVLKSIVDHLTARRASTQTMAYQRRETSRFKASLQH
jgi:hypothetical protein